MSDIIISGPAELWFAPAGTNKPDIDESFEDAGWNFVGICFDSPAQQVYAWKDANSKWKFNIDRAKMDTALSLLKEMMDEITTPFQENDIAFYCTFCGKMEFDDGSHHKPDCVWLRAAHLLAQENEPYGRRAKF